MATGYSYTPGVPIYSCGAFLMLPELSPRDGRDMLQGAGLLQVVALGFEAGAACRF